jgi:hypothetical protein
MIGEFVRSLQVRLPSRSDTPSAQAHEQGRVLGHELGYRGAQRDRFGLIVNREPTAVAVLDPYSGRHRARG